MGLQVYRNTGHRLNLLDRAYPPEFARLRRFLRPDANVGNRRVALRFVCFQAFGKALQIPLRPKGL